MYLSHKIKMSMSHFKRFGRTSVTPAHSSWGNTYYALVKWHYHSIVTRDWILIKLSQGTFVVSACSVPSSWGVPLVCISFNRCIFASFSIDCLHSIDSADARQECMQQYGQCMYTNHHYFSQTSLLQLTPILLLWAQRPQTTTLNSNLKCTKD